MKGRVMSADNLTINIQPEEHSSASAPAAAPAPDPELERLEAILLQCQQQIARHSLSLSYLWPQRDDIRDSLRSLRRRREMAALEALLQPVTFYSIEEAASL
jgi:hypothetical protein